MKRLVVLAGMTAALFATAACSNSPQGQGGPTTTGTSASDSGSGSQDTTTSSGSGNGALPSDACSLLPQSDATQHGATSSGTADTIAGYPDCQWDFGKATVGVTIYTNKGLSQLTPTGPITSLGTIGSHQASQMTSSASSSVCGVILTVTSSSVVETSVEEVPGTATSNACQDAKIIATAVEKHLPSS